jgi:hypothetical protein
MTATLLAPAHLRRRSGGDANNDELLTCDFFTGC